MNKSILGLIVGLLVIGSLPLAAQPVFSVRPVDTSVAVNGEVTLDITVGDFDDILSFQYSLNWDPNALEFVAIENVNDEDFAGLSNNIGTPGPDSQVPAGAITVSWFNPNVTSGVTVPDDTRLFTIRLRGVTDASSFVQIGENPLDIEVSKPDGSTIDPTTERAVVTVGEGGPLGPQVTLRLSDATATVGSEVCVRISVQGFMDIGAAEFSLSYDPSVLQFTAVNNLNLDGLAEGDFTTPGNGGSAGQVGLIYNAPGNAVTVPDGTTVFELCFTAQSQGTTQIQFSDNPTPIRVLDGSDQEAAVTSSDQGNVTVNQDGGGSGERGFSMESKTVQGDESFCLQVTGDNLQSLEGFQFSINYDPAQLQFDSISNLSLEGLQPSFFSTPNDVLNPGELTVSYIVPGEDAIDVPSGGLLFEVCFTAIGSGTTTVEFSDTPRIIELSFRNEQGEFESGPAATNDGVVTIEGQGSGGDGVQLNLEDVTAAQGEEVCIPVTVRNFSGMVGMQFSVNYDANALEYVSSNNSFESETSLNVINSTPGDLSIIWQDLSALGIDQPNGTTIFELCFQVTGNDGATTDLSFSGSPLEIEITQNDDNGQAVTIDASLNPGTVTIGDDGVGDGRVEISVPDTTIESGSELCIPVRVRNFSDIVGMQFSLNYDANQLTFKSSSNLGNTSETSVTVIESSEGNLSAQWQDLTALGIDLSDGSAIFEACFDVVGDDGNSSMISFSSNPLPIEVSQNNNSGQAVEIDADFVAGEVTIASLAVFSIDTAAVTDVACSGDNTGAIDIEIEGGSGDYTYQWDFENRSTQDLTDLPAGQYNVTVTDNANSETITESFSVSEPATPLSIGNVEVTGTGCNDNTGSIALTVSGGTGPYSLDWAGDLTDDETNQDNLAAGSYELTITDANGCTLSPEAIEVTVDNKVELTGINTTFIDQGNDGAIALDVSGGSGNYTYSWSGPDGFTSSEEDLAGLGRQGEYCVTVTDDEGCAVEECINMFLKLKFASVNISKACAEDASGGITVQVQGGLSPYAYNWETGAQSNELNGVAAGTYNLTVTDDKGDVLNGRFEVDEFDPIVVEASITDVTGRRDNNNGAIELSISGGTPVYTVNWDNGAMGETLQNIAAGQYCATVTDQSGCSTEACFDVEAIAVPLAVETEAVDASCGDAADGTLSMNIQGGARPYQVEFSDGITRQGITGMLMRENLPPGTLNYTITDANGETLQGMVRIGGPDPIVLEEAIVRHDPEDPGCTGSIELVLSGGAGGYNVQWNAPNNGNPIINLCEGNFIATVTDANGCQKTFEGIELTTFALDGEVIASSCPEALDGGIDLTVEGGSAPYNFSWQNERGETVATSEDLENVDPGNYTVTVEEQSGNTLVRTFEVTTASMLDLTVEVTSTGPDGHGLSCPDAEDGSLLATGVNGAGGYVYEWTRNGELIGMDAALSNVGPGTYEATVIDENGCSMTRSVELTAPPKISLNPSIGFISCSGARDGEIIVNARGGAGEFTYQWSNGGVGNRISNLRAGSYAVTVTDQNQCTTTETFEIDDPEPLTVTIETEAANDGCNGTATAIVSGGTGPYTFEWQNLNGSIGRDSILTGLCPGEYLLMVTDFNGCTAADEELTSALVEDRRFPCSETVNVISYNEDGNNDFFDIKCVKSFNRNQLEIYDRWGQLIFEAENYSNNWPRAGQPEEDLPEGAYYYVLTYTDNNGVEQQLKGSITLVRD